MWDTVEVGVMDGMATAEGVTDSTAVAIGVTELRAVAEEVIESWAVAEGVTESKAVAEGVGFAIEVEEVTMEDVAAGSTGRDLVWTTILVKVVLCICTAEDDCWTGEDIG